MQHDLNDLRAFVQVARAGGYAPASRATGLARATLSRRVAALEAALHIRLIERTSRSFRLTSAGANLAAQAGPLIAAAEDAFATLETAQPEPAGEIAFAVPASVLHLHLDGMVARYLGQYPQVRIRIEATNRRVDLRHDPFDFVIRAGDPAQAMEDLVVLPLARVAHELVCAPRWADRLRPSLSETLAEVPMLAWAGQGDQAGWTLEGTDGQPETIAARPRLIVGDMATLRGAVLSGLGLGLLPQILVAQDLQAGALIAGRFDLRAPERRIHALHTGKTGMRPLVRHFLDYLLRAYEDTCSTLPPT